MAFGLSTCKIYIVVEITMQVRRFLYFRSVNRCKYILAVSHRQSTQPSICFTRCSYMQTLQWNTHCYQIDPAPSTHKRRRKLINYAHRVRIQRKRFSFAPPPSPSLIKMVFPFFSQYCLLCCCCFFLVYPTVTNKTKHIYMENEFAIHKVRSLFIFFVQLKCLFIVVIVGSFFLSYTFFTCNKQFSVSSNT